MRVDYLKMQQYDDASANGKWAVRGGAIDLR